MRQFHDLMAPRIYTRYDRQSASAASTKSQFVSILTSRADVELLNVQHKLVYSSFVENVVFIILPLFLGETNLNLSINIEEREKSCMQNRSIAVI